MPKLIMVTGKNGQLGYELVRTLSAQGQIIAVDEKELDLSDIDKTVNFIRHYKPDVVVNAAAYTSVDKAEENENKAMQLNSVVPGVIAEELKKNNGLMVHFSTDFAFDGNKKSPYTEDDKVSPLSVYARTKVAGDSAILDSGVNNLIFRTSWIYGARGNNFLLTLLEMFKTRHELKVINNQYGAPTWSRLVAEAVSSILSKKEAYDKSYSGLYHISCGGMITWYEFAVAISKYYEHKYNNRVTIFPESGVYPMKALRPKYGVLDNKKLNDAFGVYMPDWSTAFKLVMQDLGYADPSEYSVHFAR